MTHVEHFVSIGACDEVRNASAKYTSAAEFWSALISPTGERRPDWAVWWACRVRGWEAVEQVVRRAVLRAARVYSVNECEKEGFTERAAKLRAIKDDASFEEIVRIAWAADCFATAASASYANYAYHVSASSAAATERALGNASDSAAAAPSRDREIDAQLSDISELLTCPWTDDDIKKEKTS